MYIMPSQTFISSRNYIAALVFPAAILLKFEFIWRFRDSSKSILSPLMSSQLLHTAVAFPRLLGKFSSFQTVPGPFFSLTLPGFLGSIRIHSFQAFLLEFSAPAVFLVLDSDILNSLRSHSCQALTFEFPVSDLSPVLASGILNNLHSQFFAAAARDGFASVDSLLLGLGMEDIVAANTPSSRCASRCARSIA